MKQQFINYLKNKGFRTSPVLHTLDLVPHYRKTTDGHHTLITNIDCCLFDGVDTKPGDLGCVTFYYGGIMRHKCYRHLVDAKLLKKAFCPKTAREAINTYEQWRIESAKTLATWETII